MKRKNRTRLIKPKRLLLAVLLLLLPFFSARPASDRTGTICGTVTDAGSKEPLIGATVVIPGTTTGAVTDAEGYFRIDNLRPGTYAITVSYISFQTCRLDDIPVAAGQEAAVKIELSEADLQLSDVVVVARRRLGTDAAVLNTIRSSLPVINGISAQQIGKTPDSDAAEVLRRIPGITVRDDRFIVVRGLAQRYNNVWLNDAAVPSSETDSRAFSFDVLPASLIDNLLIYKSPSAGLPADFSGGFVRILTKNIPTGNTFDVSYQAGFNTNATFRNFRLTRASGAERIGFGAGSRSLPAGAPDHLNHVSTADAAAFTRQINTGWGIRRFRAVPDQKLSLTVNRLSDTGGMKIGTVASVNYSTGYEYEDMQNNHFLSYDHTNDRSVYRYRYRDERYKNTVKLGALFNGSLLTGNNKYEFRNFFNQRGVSALTQRQGTDYYSDENIRKWESLYTGRTTYTGQLSGEHTWREESRKLDWTAGYAFAAYREPDRKVVKSTEQIRDGQTRYYVSDPTRYYQDLKEHGGSAALNYRHTFSGTGRIVPAFSGGLYGEYKKRTFDARRFVYNLLGSGYNRYADWDYSGIFTDENISADRIYLKESTNKSDSYTSDYRLGAAYAELRLKAGKKFEAGLGIRMEYYRLQLDGYESDGIKPVHLDRNNADLFPSANLAFRLTEKQLFRFAYGRSVNRAEFREIVPYVYYDFALDANITGNTGLKNAYADHIDLRYEWYPSSGETVSLGAFYKHFSDPIEQTFVEAGSGLQYTYRNAGRARAFGAELDIRKRLDGFGLNGWSFVFNGALVHSRVYFADGSFERNRPMQGQSPYLINTGLFYEHPDAGLEASVLYNRIGKRIETVGIPKQNPNDDIPDTYEMPRHAWDVSFSKKIGRYVEIKAGIKNLSNAKIVYKQILKLTDASGNRREAEQIIRSHRPGATLNLGVNVKF